MSASPEDVPSFLGGGGAVGALIRALDWSATSLGPPARWPAPLRTTIRILLTTNHPAFIFWGPQALCFYNDAYSRSLGPEKHPSILGRPGRESWPEIWDITGPQFEQVMAGEGATWHENQLVPIVRNGRLEQVYWTYSYSPIDDDSAASGIGGVLVLCTETTEQVLAAERLKAAEARWRSLFEQAPGFMCILSAPGQVFEFANPAFFELVGRHDIIGRSAREAFPWAVEQGFIDQLDEVCRSGTAFTAQTAPIRVPGIDDATGTPRYLDFVFQPIRNDLGEVTGVFVLGFDVTERKLADQRRNAFLATLGHELRNPLAPITSALQLLKLNQGDEAVATRARDLIERQVDQLVRLIDDLLDVVRVNLGRIELIRRDVRLEEVVRSALETVAPHIDRAQRRLEVELRDGSSLIHADEMRLAQVFSNLLINACKYSDPDTTITLSSERSADDRIIVRVRDRGIGIPANTLSRIFEMFSQAESSLARSEGGLGVGLALARGIVELHGGTLSAFSDGEGKGSEFIVSLPAASATLSAAPDPDSRTAKGDRRASPA